MRKTKIYKCRFKHCNHKPCEVLQGEAVKVSNGYMHGDCAEINKNILKIRDLYYESVSRTVVMKQLVSVINNLVFIKHVDSDFLLFALNHVISSKIPIKSPYGLHYIIDNRKIKELWNKKQTQIISDKIREETEKIVEKNMVPNAFSYSLHRSSGFGGIINGG